MKNFRILIFLSFIGLLFRCSEDEAEGLKSLKLNFVVMADDKPLVFDSNQYQNSLGQSITIERIKIYLSNIKLFNAKDEEVFVEEDSYHLLSFHKNASEFTIVMNEVPTNILISKVTFSIGVDAARNSSIDNVGDLDPANGMAWDWNTGYKFFLLEGAYHPVDDPTKGLIMHIGSDANYFIKDFMLSTPIEMQIDQTVEFFVDGLSPFGTLDLFERNTFHSGPEGDKVAENYKNSLFTLRQ